MRELTREQVDEVAMTAIMQLDTALEERNKAREQQERAPRSLKRDHARAQIYAAYEAKQRSLGSSQAEVSQYTEC